MGRPLRHMPALDGLRGFAIAGVLLFHAGHLTGGYLGVDLFFVLSGFLITSLLLAERRATGRVSLAAFWVRRARRLLPALFGLLAGVAVYAAVWADRGELEGIRADALATLGYVANWRAIFARQRLLGRVRGALAARAHVEPRDRRAVLPGVAARRSLALLWLAPGIGAARCSPARSLLAAASAAWMFVSYTPGDDPERVYLGTDTRGAAILAGAALAAAFAVWGTPVRRDRAARGRGCRHRRLRRARVGVGHVRRPRRPPVPGRLPRVRARGGGRDRGGGRAPHRSARPGRSRCVRYERLGVISYGLYLWHWPVYVVLTPERTGVTEWPLTAVRVDHVARDRGGLLLPARAPDPPPWPPHDLAAGSGAGRRNHDRARGRGRHRGRHRITLDADRARRGPHQRLASGRTRARGQAGPTVRSDLVIDWAALALAAHIEAAGPSAAPKRILVVGDSVAFTLGATMESHSDELGGVAWNRSVVDCNLNETPVPVRFPDGTVHGSTRPCGPSWANDVNRFQPEIVFLLLGAPGLTEIRLGDEWAGPCSPTYDSWYHDRLVDAVATLSAGGARVVIGTAPVPMAFGPVDETTRCLNSVHRQVTAELANARVLDLGEYVCPGRSVPRADRRRRAPPRRRALRG